jgi:hypothetical protein
MNDFKALCRKYSNPEHEFLVVGRERLPGKLKIYIEAERKQRHEVYSFARDCLGPGLLTQTGNDVWEYEIRE